MSRFSRRLFGPPVLAIDRLLRIPPDSAVLAISPTIARAYASSVDASASSDDGDSGGRVVRSELFHQGGFVDRWVLRVEGGGGGGGGIHWSHRKGSFKLAAGGHGGDGGNVRVAASNDYADLSHLQFAVRAEPGGKGGKNQATGACGADTIIKVPPGTAVYDLGMAASALRQEGFDLGGPADASEPFTSESRSEGRAAPGRSAEGGSDRASRWDSASPAGGRPSASSGPSRPPRERVSPYGVFATYGGPKGKRPHLTPISMSPLGYEEERDQDGQDGGGGGGGGALSDTDPLDESDMEEEDDVDPADLSAMQLMDAEARQRAEDKARVTSFWDQYLGPQTEAPALMGEEAEEEEGSDSSGAFSDRFGEGGPGDALSDEEARDEGPSVAALLEALKLSGREPPLLADLVSEGQSVAVALGGEGGKGNSDMPKVPGRPQPSYADRGTDGEMRLLLLELKCIADIGLVGFPNAGKSTLLRCLTAATPRVAAYPFTTLRPYLGALIYGDGLQVRVADLPGIVEGAHQDKGLGLRFLRHVERTRAIAYVVDTSAGLPGSAENEPRPWHQLDLLKEELRRYDDRLLSLPSIVVASKIDLLRRPRLTMSVLRRRAGVPVFPVSHDGTGYDRLREAFRVLALSGGGGVMPKGEAEAL